MFGIKRIVTAVVALALAAGMFTGCEEKISNSGLNIEDVPQAQYNYLTGLPFESEEDKSVRPIAVMVDNLKVAVPQSGLSSADIIYEAVTEGGITRMMAVYSDIDDIQRVGPVRSARDRFVELMLPLNAIYVHIGSSTSAQRMLNFYSYQDIDGIYLSFVSFEYDSELAKTKSAEHCWFTNKDLIKAGIEKNSIRTKNNFYPAFEFVEYKNEARVPEEQRANTVSFKYSGYADVSFIYDESTGKYLKNAFGIPHMDALTNRQLSFDNVFVLTAQVGIQEENGILPDFDMSEGEGYYFYGGMCEKVRWKKGAPENPLIIYNEDGEVIKVNPGKSYVGLLDEEMLDTLTISEETQSVSSVERVQ